MFGNMYEYKKRQNDKKIKKRHKTDKKDKKVKNESLIL